MNLTQLTQLTNLLKVDTSFSLVHAKTKFKIYNVYIIYGILHSNDVKHDKWFPSKHNAAQFTLRQFQLSRVTSQSIASTSWDCWALNAFGTRAYSHNLVLRLWRCCKLINAHIVSEIANIKLSPNKRKMDSVISISCLYSNAYQNDDFLCLNKEWREKEIFNEFMGPIEEFGISWLLGEFMSIERQIIKSSREKHPEKVDKLLIFDDGDKTYT